MAEEGPEVIIRDIVRSGADFLEWLDRTFPGDTRVDRAEFNRMPESDEGAAKLEEFGQAVDKWRKYLAQAQAIHALERLFMDPRRN